MPRDNLDPIFEMWVPFYNALPLEVIKAPMLVDDRRQRECVKNWLRYTFADLTHLPRLDRLEPTHTCWGLTNLADSRNVSWDAFCMFLYFQVTVYKEKKR